MTGFDAAGFGIGLGITLGVVAVLMLGTFAIALRVGRHSVIDATWGLGFPVVAVVVWGLSFGEGGNGRRTVILVLTAIWGLRLATHIYLRARKHTGEDPRYDEMLSGAEDKGVSRNAYAATKIYLTQGVSLWFISLPVQIAMFSRDGFGVLGYIGIAVWAVGEFFEAVGDYQLTRFRNDPDSKGKVLDTGLWRYTRHPNYFGDACVWWGLSLIAFAHLPGIATILSPVLMTFLLAKGTGAKLLESDIGDRRPGYADYIRRTSGFVPLPPKKTPPTKAAA